MARRALHVSWQKRLAMIATTALAGIGLVVSPTAPIDQAQAAACSAGYVVPVHGPVAYHDTGFEAKYLGYKVTPTANVADLKVRVTINSGAVIALETNQPGTQGHGAVSASQSIHSYFLTDINTSSNTAASITVEVLDGSTVICDFTDTMATQAPTIAANANKITSATVTNSGATVTNGSTSVVTVRGQTGTLGTGPQAKNDINLTPVAKIGSFNPAAWQLVRVEFFSETAGCNAGQPIVNRLYIANDTSPSSTNCGGDYRANYSFKVREGFQGSNSSSIDAFGYIASGTQMKHTDPYSQAITLPGVNTATGTLLIAAEPNLQNLNQTYTLTYTNTGATSGSAPSATTGNGTVSVAGSATLVRTGFTFGGWSIGGTTYQAGSNYNLAASVSATPVWISNSTTYTITYASTGQTSGSVPAAQTGVGAVNLDNNSGSLARTNYVFGGWSISSTTYQGGASYNLVADVTATAIWIPAPKVITFDANGATSGSAPSNLSGSGGVTLPGNTGSLVRSGFTFAGWATTNNASSALDSNYNLTADITLFAVWLPEFTITYSGNGNTGGSVPNPQTGNGIISLAQNSGVLVKTGFVFDGWSIGGQYFLAGSNYNLASSVTATAVWLPVFTITFDGNGSDGGSVPSPISGNGPVNLPGNTNSLTKSGFTFLGWAASNSASSALGTSYNLSASITLYAVWAAAQAPASSAPCIPSATTINASGELGLIGVIGRLLAGAVDLAAKGSQWAMNQLMAVPVLSAMAENQVAAVAPTLSLDGFENILRDSTVFTIAAAAKPKTTAPLTTDDVTIVPGDDPNTIEIQSTDGSSLQLLDSNVIDYKTQTLYSGSDFNNPATWVALGYGMKCWKLEPFNEQYFYTLPSPIQLPAGTAAGDWRYSHVIVKAGSLTSRSETYQTDTVYPAPKPGAQVWPDINANGIFDPGGATGDKAISHVIVCITNASVTLVPTVTPDASPSSTPTSSPTQTATPTSSATPTPTGSVTATPTQSVAPTPSPTGSVTPTPTQSVTPTPTPQQLIVGCPEPTPPTASPEPTKDPVIKILIIDPSPSASPSPTSSPTPSGSATPTPSPTGSATPSPTPTTTASPSPSATPSPSGSASPTPTATPTNPATPRPTEPVDPADVPAPVVSNNTATPCQADINFGFAFLVSNGESSLCYRATTESVLAIASFGGLPFLEDGVFTTDEEPTGELAATGFENQTWLFIAMLLMGLGGVALVYARRRD